MESLKKFWPKDKFGEIQLTAIKEGEAKTIKILKMYNTVMWTGFVALCSMPLVQRKNLPVTWMSFCDIQNNLYCYIFNYILQIICIAKLLHLLLSMDTLLFILLWHGYSELEKIKHGLLQFNISNFSETVAAHGIASLVEQHCSVLM